MDLSTGEIAALVIFGIPGLILVVIAIFFLSGLLKKSADPENKSGVIGWVIAVIVALLIIFFMSIVNKEPQYRHSENNAVYFQNTCSA